MNKQEKSNSLDSSCLSQVFQRSMETANNLTLMMMKSNFSRSLLRISSINKTNSRKL